MDGFYTLISFQGYQEHQNWSSNKEVMQVPKLEENQQTLQHLQLERLLNFDVFRHHMSSYFINPYINRFYTSRDFQRYQEHPNQILDDKVMTFRSWSKNRGLQQRRDVAETEHPDVTAMSRSLGSVLGGFLAHFEPIMEGFKAQTGGIEKEEDW